MMPICSRHRILLENEYVRWKHRPSWKYVKRLLLEKKNRYFEKSSAASEAFWGIGRARSRKFDHTWSIKLFQDFLLHLRVDDRIGFTLKDVLISFIILTVCSAFICGYLDSLNFSRSILFLRKATECLIAVFNRNRNSSSFCKYFTVADLEMQQHWCRNAKNN